MSDFVVRSVWWDRRNNHANASNQRLAGSASADRDSWPPELYDLDLDPFEERNVYDERRALAGEMSERLDTLTRRASRRAAAREETTVPPALRRSLGALGYVGFGAMVERHGAPDPKDCIGVYNARQNPHTKLLVDTPVPCH